MKQIFTTLRILMILILGSIIVAPLTVGALTPKEAACSGAGLAAGSGNSGCTSAPGSPTPDSLVKKGLNLFSAIIGIVAVVMIMVGGLKYITSQGDATATASAKNTILYASIGLVVVALAQIIVKFVLDRFA